MVKKRIKRNLNPPNITEKTFRKYPILVTYDLPTLMKRSPKGYRIHSKGSEYLRRYVLRKINELISKGEAIRLQQSVFLMTPSASEEFQIFYTNLAREPWKVLENTRLERWEQIKWEKIFRKADLFFRLIVISVGDLVFYTGG